MFLKTEERPQGEVAEQRGRLKLSEAMGMSNEPLCRRGPFIKGEACAMMSAYEAATGARRGSYNWTMVEEYWMSTVPISTILKCARLNDEGESRKKIISFLQTQGL